MGAAALMHDREVRDRLQAYINVEATGWPGRRCSSRPDPANHWLIGAWAPARAASARRLVCASRSTTGSRTTRTSRSSAGTRFPDSISRSSATATRITRPAILPIGCRLASLRTTGENIVGILDALQQVDITRRTARAGDLLRHRGLAARRLQRRVRLDVIAVAVVLGLSSAGFASRVSSCWRKARAAGCWASCGRRSSLTAVAGAMVGATWILRAAREVYHPWYAQPDRFFLMLVVGRRVHRLDHGARRALDSRRARGLRHPGGGVDLHAASLDPAGSRDGLAGSAAAYLWTLPLLAAGFAALADSVRSARVPCASHRC